MGPVKYRYLSTPEHNMENNMEFYHHHIYMEFYHHHALDTGLNQF